MRTPKSLAVAGTLAAALLASGCAAGAAPGSAARIGEDTIALSEVDRTAELYCAARGQESVALPMSELRSQVLVSEMVRTVADQMAEEYGLRPGAGYEQAVTAAERELGALPEAQREAVLRVETAGSYIQDIASAAAQEELSGISGVTQEQLQEKALDIYARWTDEHPAVIDPRFRLSYAEGRFTPTSGDLSVPVSETAREALLLEQFNAATDPTQQQALRNKVVQYAGSLPSSQRCA